MRRPRRLLPVPLLVLALAGGLSGCGGTDESPDAPAAASEKADPEDTACRDKWRDLADEVGDKAEDEHPSALAGRWTSVAATIDYYAVSGSASDCTKTLGEQTEQLEAIDALSASLRRYDVAYQHDRLEDDAMGYAPPKQRKGAAKAPSRRAVRGALATLEEKAARSAADQEAGWQQATAIDPTEAKARRKAQKDLAFLSEESKAWRQARTAQRTVERALRAADR